METGYTFESPKKNSDAHKKLRTYLPGNIFFSTVTIAILQVTQITYLDIILLKYLPRFLTTSTKHIFYAHFFEFPSRTHEHKSKLYKYLKPIALLALVMGLKIRLD